MVHCRMKWQNIPRFFHKNPMNSMKMQKDMTLKDEHHPSQKVSNVLTEKSIIIIVPRKKEETGPKQK